MSSCQGDSKHADAISQGMHFTLNSPDYSLMTFMSLMLMMTFLTLISLMVCLLYLGRDSVGIGFGFH